MRIGYVAVAMVWWLAVPLAAQQTSETGFVSRLGTDTTHVERVTRAGPRLSGIHLTRVPETIVREWSAELAPDGAVRRFEQTLSRRGEVLSRRSMVFARDSVTNTFVRGDSTTSRTLPAPPGALPDLPSSYGFIEVALQRLAGRDSISFSLLSLGGQPAEPAALVRGRGDTVTLRLEDLPTITLHVDGAGRIVRVSHLGMAVERVAPPDMAALGAAFANRPLGQLSPRDTVRAAIGGARVLVDYSRPARRGRTVFGGLVPWNQVWRTGANRTTTLVTDADLLIGGTTVPAGSYALFTIPAPSGWTLIINRNIGSGLEYDERQDLARVPLPATRLAEPVERFTIALEPGRDGREGVLSFSWEHTRAAVTLRRN